VSADALPEQDRRHHEADDHHGGAGLLLADHLGEAGAAAELSADALMINPYDVTGTAEALHQALMMTDSERRRRGASLARAAAALPPARWFAAQLAALDQLG